MIICIPSTEKKGPASAVSEHFGRAPFHYIINTETGGLVLQTKPEGEHGQCVPVQTLLRHQVEMVLCNGIGRGAVMNFKAAGIPVMRTSAATVAEAVQDVKLRKLTAVREEDYCSGHDH
jgi:predicted Fe-Mo cluster-binding NifX family protein